MGKSLVLTRLRVSSSEICNGTDILRHQEVSEIFKELFCCLFILYSKQNYPILRLNPNSQVFEPTVCGANSSKSAGRFSSPHLWGYTQDELVCLKDSSKYTAL